MKVALLRCHGLRKYEMQCFEPLKDIIEIKAFTPWEHNFDLSEITLPIEKIPIPSKLSRFLRDIKNLSRGRRGNLYRKSDFFLPQFEERLRQYDIIHVGEISSKSSYIGAALKKKYGMKLVATVWENIPFFDVGEELKKFIFEIVYPCIDFFITPTERGKNVLTLEGVPPDRIKTVYPGIDVERFSPGPPDTGIQKKLGIKEEHRVVFFAGRLVYKKGIYTLCQAVKEIKRLEPGIPLKLIMAGKGPEGEKLKKYIETLGLKRDIILAGSISYRDMPLFHNLAEVFVLPSIPTETWQEQFGFVLAEAMSSGKAIITTLTGAIEEVVGDGAVVIPADDYASCARQIIRLLGDENLRRHLGEKARRIALSRYDNRKTSREILSVYEHLLSV